jgi:hypothetical protein
VKPAEAAPASDKAGPSEAAAAGGGGENAAGGLDKGMVGETPKDDEGEEEAAQNPPSSLKPTLSNDDMLGTGEKLEDAWEIDVLGAER